MVHVLVFSMWFVFVFTCASLIFVPCSVLFLFLFLFVFCMCGSCSCSANVLCVVIVVFVLLLLFVARSVCVGVGVRDHHPPSYSYYLFLLSFSYYLFLLPFLIVFLIFFFCISSCYLLFCFLSSFLCSFHIIFSRLSPMHAPLPFSSAAIMQAAGAVGSQKRRKRRRPLVLTATAGIEVAKVMGVTDLALEELMKYKVKDVPPRRRLLFVFLLIEFSIFPVAVFFPWPC